MSLRVVEALQNVPTIPERNERSSVCFSIHEDDSVQGWDKSITPEENRAMKDRDFLFWIYERLRCVYGEPEHIDYMIKLRSVILGIPSDQETATTSASLDAIKAEWGRK